MSGALSRLLAGTVSAIALNTAAASAQEINLDPISVFATAGGSISAFLYPGQVSVIEKSAIEDLQASRPSDIFEGVPGIVFDGGPRRTGQLPNVRGFEGQSVVVLFDDARQNYSSGHTGRFFVDPDLFRSAEVVKGPTSSIYGSGALGGVIAFRTIEAADLLEPGQNAAVRVKAGFQSVDDEQSYAITGVQRSESGDIDLVAHLGYRNSSDIELGSGATLPAGDKLGNALVKGAFSFADGFKWTTSWIYYHQNSDEPLNPQGINIAGPDNALVGRKVENSTLQSKLEWNPANNDFIDSKIVAYRTNNEVEDPEITGTRVVTREVETLGLKASNTSRFMLAPNAGLKWTYGTDIYRDEQTGTDSDTTTGIRNGVPDASTNFLGFYSEAEFEFGRMGEGLGQLTLIPGIRWDKFRTQSSLADEIDESALSPKIAATWSPTQWFSLFGNYGKAFRAPSYDEAYSIGQHFAIPVGAYSLINEFIPNPGLKPEKALGWEAGAAFKFENVISQGDIFRVKGSYFENTVEDLIELQVNMDFANVPWQCYAGPPFPCVTGSAIGWTTQSVNVSNARLDGIEIEASYDSTYFYGRATYAQINGVDLNTGGYAGNLYPDRFFVDAGIKIPVISTRLGARATFADDFTKTDTVSEYRDSYEVFDIYAIWQPTGGTWKGFRVDLGIDNISDEDYEVVAAGVSEEGRNYRAGISYTIPICGTSACPY